MPKNKDNTPVRAKIIGLWGDPGISEYYNFDVFSRFLIVQINPFDDIACSNDASSIIKLVLRPPALWINSFDAGDTRRDFLGSLNRQDRTLPHDDGRNAATFYERNISPISPSYKIGDEITLIKLTKPLAYDATNFKDGTAIFNDKFIFSSEDSGGGPSGFMSDSYKNQEPAFSSSALVSSVSLVTLPVFTPPIVGLPGISLKLLLGDAGDYLRSLTKILDRTTKYKEFLNPNRVGGTFNITRIANELNSSKIISDKGGLVDEFSFISTEYIDSNSDGRTRLQDSGCLPLIVANPSTFPTPANRNLGGINITL